MGGLTDKIKAKILFSCLECDEKFSLQDAINGKYKIETNICISCYKKKQRNPDTCFGKKTKGRRLGYDEEDLDCSEFCPDRKICREFVEKKKDSI